MSSFSFFASAGSIYCDNAFVPLHKARSWEELHKTRYVDMVPPRRGPNAQTDKIAQEAWEEYMNNYGHLPSVCQVIQTLKEAAESGDATEDIQ